MGSPKIVHNFCRHLVPPSDFDTSISRISVAPRILENHFSFSTADCKYHQFFNIFA